MTLSTDASDLRALDSDLGFALGAGAADVRVTIILFEFVVVRLIDVDEVGTEIAFFSFL